MKFMKKIIASLLLITLCFGVKGVYNKECVVNAATEMVFHDMGSLKAYYRELYRTSAIVIQKAAETDYEKLGDGYIHVINKYHIYPQKDSPGLGSYAYIDIVLKPRGKKEEPKGESETPTVDSPDDYNTQEDEPIYDPTTATEISYEEDDGTIKITVKLDKSDAISNTPELKLKIGNETVNAEYKSQDGNQLLYELKIQEKWYDNDITVDSFSGEDFESNISGKKLCTLKTIYAKNMEMILGDKGIYTFKLNIDTEEGGSISKKQMPEIKVKIGDETKELVSKTSGSNYLTYTIQINDTKYIGKKVTLESISGGDVKYSKQNTIGRIDYEEKLDKNLGVVDNFIQVKQGFRGDINYDGRLDKVDADKILKSTKKDMADLNGDGEININDKKALEKAIEKLDLIYLNFIVVGTKDDNGNHKQFYGDISDASGNKRADGIVNYSDFEYISNQIAKDSSWYDRIADVNGDGKVNSRDCALIRKALQNDDQLYIHYVKVRNNAKGDLNSDEIINSQDFDLLKEEIEKYKKDSNYQNNKADINEDGRIDVRDSAKLYTIILNENAEELQYIAVPPNTVGDIDGNGIINISDARILLASLDTKTVESIVGYDLSIADVNGDKEITKEDGELIKEALKNYGSYSNEAYATIISNGYLIIPEEDMGDIDGDGFLTVKDAQQIAKYLAATNKDDYFTSEYVIKHFSISELTNEKLTNDDLQKIADYKAGKIKMDELKDYNEDGKVNVRDVTSMIKDLKSEVEKRIDYNGDGSTNIRDAAKIAKNISELICYWEEPESIILEDKDNTFFGDVDTNGEIGISDVTKLAKYLVNPRSYPLDEQQLKNADVNGNNVVDSIDLSRLIEYNLNKITSFTTTKESEEYDEN